MVSDYSYKSGYKLGETKEGMAVNQHSLRDMTIEKVNETNLVLLQLNEENEAVEKAYIQHVDIQHLPALGQGLNTLVDVDPVNQEQMDVESEGPLCKGNAVEGGSPKLLINFKTRS